MPGYAPDAFPAPWDPAKPRDAAPKRTLIRLACALGVDAVFQWWNRHRLLILTYHGVAAEQLEVPCALQLPVGEFARQLAWLRDHYRFLRLDEALERLETGTLPPRVCVLTFDDGYRNVLTTAAPLLQRAGIPATVFLVSGLVGTGTLLWPDRVRAALHGRSEDRLDLPELGLAGIPFRTPAERSRAISTVNEILKCQPQRRKDALVESVLSRIGEPRAEHAAPFRLLDWADVKALAAMDLFTFGAHSYSHEILSRCGTEELERQTGGAVRELRLRLGTSRVFFVYPNGRWLDIGMRAKAAVANAGCSWALSAGDVLADRRLDPMEVPRLGVPTGLDFGTFRLVTAGVPPLHRRLPGLASSRRSTPRPRTLDRALVLDDVETEVVREPAQLQHHLDDWEDLVARASEPSLFTTPTWIRTWLDSHWQGRPISFLFVRRDEHLIVLAPFLTGGHSPEHCRGALVFPADGHVYGSNVLHCEEPVAVLGSLLRFIRESLPETRVQFPRVRRHGSLGRLLPGVASALGMTTVRIPAPPAHLIRLGGQWPARLRKRSGHTFREIRRKVRKLPRAGRLVDVTRDDGCLEAMGDVVEIERRSWKHGVGAALSTRTATERFFRAFTRAAARRGWLRLHLLYLEDQPVAHLYGVAYAGRYHALRTAYDQAYASLSPGIVLFDHALREAQEEGLEAFSLGVGDDPWKHEIVDEHETYEDLCAVPQSSGRCELCDAYNNTWKPLVRRRAPGLVAWRNRLPGQS